VSTLIRRDPVQSFGRKDPMSPDVRRAIQATWIHSHEEDQGDRMVFRSADFDFPPSRGRIEFSLKPGGVVEVVRPGPDDRRRKASGRWTLAGKRLEIEAPGFSGSFDVEEVDHQRLVVRRVGKET
jgi:hypothetical protein